MAAGVVQSRPDELQVRIIQASGERMMAKKDTKTTNRAVSVAKPEPEPTPPEDQVPVEETVVMEDPSVTKKATANIKQAKAKALEDKVLEVEALTAADPDRPDTKTMASEPKQAEVEPGIQLIDIAGLKEWFGVHSNWLRDRGATVTGPNVVAVEIPETSGASVTNESGVGSSATAKTRVVYEGTYKWKYDDLPATQPNSTQTQRITKDMTTEQKAEILAQRPQQLISQVVQTTEIDAWRDLAQNVLVRRYEV
jgi:ABC-type microcin C transport system duplicated ATPase subunit YejF